MTHHQTHSASGSETIRHDRRPRTLSTAAIATGVVSLILLVALAVPYYALQNPWLVAVFVLGAAAAIGGLVLARRARRAPSEERRTAALGFATALAALILALIPWPAVGNAQYTTSESSTWITITAPTDSDDQTVGCKIYWNDELVVEETSNSGTVSCEYAGD
ncbi:Uncharacterised protein [Mycobacterium tuberculosis]|nr:Uncharacterised protein [Mycobacterium tuberculosis]